MFTIHHAKPDGTSDLFTAVRLQHIPESEENGNTAGLHCLCGPSEAGPGIVAGVLRDGAVYVMNEKGATVATYHLDKPKVSPREAALRRGKESRP